MLWGYAVYHYFMHWTNSLYREYYPTEIYANQDIIDADILVTKNRQESLESPYQAFQRFFVYTHWWRVPLRLFRPMEINKSIINHAVMRTNEVLLWVNILLFIWETRMYLC